jgi:hypothetical protein
MEYIKKLRHSFTEPNTVDRVVTAGGERRELATIWPYHARRPERYRRGLKEMDEVRLWCGVLLKARDAVEQTPLHPSHSQVAWQLGHSRQDKVSPEKYSHEAYDATDDDNGVDNRIEICHLRNFLICET